MKNKITVLLLVVWMIMTTYHICMIQFKIEDIYDKMPKKSEVSTYVTAEYVIFKDHPFEASINEEKWK